MAKTLMGVRVSHVFLTDRNGKNQRISLSSPLLINTYKAVVGGKNTVLSFSGNSVESVIAFAQAILSVAAGEEPDGGDSDKSGV